MLGAHPIYPVLLATDLAAARDFYHTKLGLEILNESEAAIVFRCGGGTQLSVTVRHGVSRSAVGGAPGAYQNPTAASTAPTPRTVPSEWSAWY